MGRLGIAIGFALAFAGCIAPADQRPGLWLSGEPTPLPADWSFSDAHREVALEVAAPYLLPHSVTIWCVAHQGALFVAAREPDTKRWPGWVERDPDVRLGIGDALYEARLERLDDQSEIEGVRRAYGAKYALPEPDGSAPPMRYWRVGARVSP